MGDEDKGKLEEGAGGAEEEQKEPPPGLCWALLKMFFLDKPLLALLYAFVPAAFYLMFTEDEENPPRELATFACCLLAIVPLAERLGYVTEQCAARSSEAIAGLLNASFGNVPELAATICAIRQRQDTVAVETLIGGILSALLVVSGLSALIGGMRHRVQTYNRNLATTLCSVTLFVAAVVGLVTYAENEGYAQHGQLKSFDLGIVGGSRLLAILALGLYGCFLLFSLHTHKDLCESEGEEEEEPEIGIYTGISTMAVLIAIITVLSDGLVDSIDGAVEHSSLPHLFICAVIIPNVNNALEHSVAIMMAWRNKVDASIATSVGSAAQLAALLLPLAIIASWIAGGTISFAMNPSLLAVNLVVGSLFTALILQSGETTWLHGMALCLVYIAICTTYFYVGPDDYAINTSSKSPRAPPSAHYPASPPPAVEDAFRFVAAAKTAADTAWQHVSSSRQASALGHPLVAQLLTTNE